MGVRPGPTEWRLLHWEHTRLAKELRGLQALLRALRKPSGESQPALCQLVAAPSDEDLSSPAWRAATAALREENGRLAREVRGAQLLVARLVASKRGGAAEVGAPGSPVRGTVRHMPGDGSCLFHCLAAALADGTEAEGLRAELADFVAQHPHAVVAGEPIQQWVAWESGGLAPEAYAAAMRDGGEWGGAIELAVCSELKQVSVQVYQRAECSEGFERICVFAPSRGGGGQRVASLLYRPGHYDLLDLAPGG